MMRHSGLKQALAIGLLSICAHPAAWAADDEWALGEKIATEYSHYSCGQSIPLQAAQPAAYAHLKRLQGVSVDKHRLPLLLGNSSPWGGGTIVFYQQANQWQARVMEMGTSVTQVYTNPARDAYWIFFMHTAEAPGNIQYLHITAKDARCVALVAPTTLNQPGWAMEYVDLVAFNLDAQGYGNVQGSAELDQETSHAHTQWYTYNTRNGGKTWSAPLPIPKPAQAPAGVWQLATATPPSAALLKGLMR